MLNHDVMTGGRVNEVKDVFGLSGPSSSEKSENKLAYRYDTVCWWVGQPSSHVTEYRPCSYSRYWTGTGLQMEAHIYLISMPYPFVGAKG